MQIEWDVFKAMTQCRYKAWNMALEKTGKTNFLVDENIIHIDLPAQIILAQDKLATIAWHYNLDELLRKHVDRIRINAGTKSEIIKFSKPSLKAQKLLSDTLTVINKTEPPPFYRNPHCPQCHLKDACIKKLKERDCISLLGGMSPKALVKYHKKGIFSILQLSHLFKPRRRGRMLSLAKHGSGAYPFELKALAIREQKTYILQKPELPENPVSIYIDFEGVDFIYLIGVIVIGGELGPEPGEGSSYWANTENDEKSIFQNLFDLFAKYPEAVIYHYGSYEPKALRQANKKYSFIPEFSALEKRMINILGFLRTHVYPPTYGNGLKEVGKFLGFEWSDPEATGLLSMEWRKNWEQTAGNKWKQKLIDYNGDDCRALKKVTEWLAALSLTKGTANGKSENVQQVSEMKRHSPYKFDRNPEFGEDFNLISKAAYFDYQRTKIYWRNQRKSTKPKNGQKHFGRGVVIWQPKKANEIIVVPPLTKCPFCGHRKIYHSSKLRTFKQTDLKFTASGVKQWIREYRSGSGKCAKCRKQFNDSSLRMVHFGNDLFAWAVNLYVNYHISHEMISKLLEEQYGIWANRLYFLQRKEKWFQQFKPEVDYLWETIKKSPVIHIDETMVRLSKESGYVWVFATTHTVFYHFTMTRESGFLQEWLKDYQGIIISDFFPGYESLPFKRQKCLIHLIRDLNDDLFKNPFDEEYKALVVGFGKLLRNIIETIDRYGLKKRNLHKHIKNTDQFKKQFLERSHTGELSVKYSKRILKHWDDLWTFLHHDGVPWNNNNAEAAVKAFAYHRREVNGKVSEKGLREYLQMLSLAQTCRFRNISFFDFLRHKAGIWQNVPAEILPGYLPFEQTKLFAQKLNFKTKEEWKTWLDSGKRPPYISPDYFFIKQSTTPAIHGQRNIKRNPRTKNPLR